MKYEFKNKEGKQLVGQLELPEGTPQVFALFAHCFTCSKDFVASRRIAKALTEHGIGVLRFDFTGLGNSEGDFSNTNFSSNVEDLMAAFEALSQDYEAPQLLIGHSLGGAAVLKAATKLDAVKAVVTIGAPSSVDHVTHLFEDKIPEIKEDGCASVTLEGREFQIKKQFLEDIHSTDLLEQIKDLRKAVLIMHSPTDNVVSIDHAAEIFKNLKHPKSFISLNQAHHLLTKKKDATYVAQSITGWMTPYLKL